MSDSEESNGSDQQYTVVDEIAPETDSRRRTRRRDSKPKKAAAATSSQPEFESEEDNSNSNVASRYEEDEDYHEPLKKKRGSRGSEKRKSRKSKSKSHDSDEEVPVDDEDSERAVPPLKIKLPPREKSKRSSKRKNEIDDGVLSNEEDELDGNVASSSSRSKSKSNSNGNSSNNSKQQQQEDSTHVPTRRSERIFVSNTKKVPDLNDEFEELPIEEEPFKIIHKDYCQSCRQGGELILCDYCPRAFHKVCLDDELPEELPEDWCCPNCEKNGKPDPKELRQQQEALVAKKKKKQKEVAVSSSKPKGKKEIENRDYCEICNQCGELLLCDTCPRAYHLVCMDADMKAIPSGTWSCPHCIEHGIEVSNDDVVIPEEKAEKVEKIICKGCRQSGGEIIFCATCPTRFHIQCMNPPLDEAPEEWHCMACSVEPLKAKVQRILTWRWKKTPQEAESDKSLSAEDSTKNLLKNLKNRRPREREFFVKWKDMSYWHTSWVDDSQLQVFHSNLYRFYIQKNDMSNPPIFDEVGTISTESIESKSDDSNSTDINDTDQGIKASVAAKHRRQKRCCNLSPELEKTYVRYGIRPEWLLIQRIINHRKSRGKLYYVIKWRDLPYEEVTVEPEPENCDFEIPDYQKKIDEYWNLKRLIDEENADPEEKSSKKRDKDDKRKKDKRKKAFGSVPKSDPKKKWDDQPDYIPEPLKLHEYQVEGCTWLRFSWASGIDTILADEMGLGKTIQTITFLYSLYKEGHSRGPFLIAAPLSTIINWERELEDWAPDFYVVNYTGNKDSRIIIRENELSFDSDATRSSAKASRIRKNIPVKFHVMLTSYELINMDSALLSSIDWKVLVVDEAHRLKSNQSLFFRTLNNYSVAHKLLLTGTPLQNNLEELFNLLNFLSPSRFCDMEGFLSEFADIAKEEQVKKLHELLGSHLLRRLKADVLSGMPSKSEFIIRVDLAPLQKKYYKYILTRNYAALNSKGIGKQVSLLNVVMDLKKCCNHPYLFPVAAEEAPKTKFGYFEGAPLVKACGKLLVLHKMLQKLKADGHRVLIFSQMTHMLDILEDFCEAEGYKYERIDGSITGSLRQESIDRFNAPGAQQFVFLLSTRAGGLGINLATADTVIIYDSDWNPHNDIQALSRAHRIGQTNKVMIYRFVTRNSVEERITQVAKKKMMLTHLVVRPGLGSAKSNTAMSKQELDDILKFGTEELFKEEEGKETETIHYDDKAIEDLLDRSNEGIEQKEMWSNEYLSSFKVASYATKEVEEEEVEVAPPKPEKDESQNDPHYWEKLLGVHYVQYQENVSRTLGKGKRVRKQVNYMDSTTGQNEFQTQDSSGESSEFSVPSDQSENDEDFDEKIESRNQKSLRTKNPIREKMPPLLSQMGPNTEVIGFTPKHRKTFLDLVMRFGLPSLEHNITDSQFYVRELKSKSEKHLRAYASLFISHLCEPGDPSSLTFDDGVPKEGLNVSQVLTRIGIISLIKRKVFEYQHKHGDVSMKLVKKPQISLIAQPNSSANGNELIDPVKNETNEANDKVAPPTTSDDKKEKVEDCKEEKESDEVKEKVVDDDDKEKAAADDKDKIDDEIKEKVDELKDKVDEEMKDKADEDEKEEIKKEESMEVDEPAKDKKESEELKKEDTETDSKNDDSKVKEEDSTAENSTAKVDKVDESNQDKPVKTETNGVIEVKSDDEEEVSETEVKQFEFSIQDGGLTELHTLWYFEDKELKPKHEHEIWNRRHDFWMLAGIVKHGYERWSDVSRDEVFCILNEPFKSSSHLRDKFMERRLRLLEQALVFEEQLRRFSHLETAEKLVAKPAKESEKMAVDSEENKEDVENEKEGKVSEDKEEEETVQNGDKEVEEDKNEEETEAKQNGDKNKEDKVDKKKNGDTKKVDDNEDVEEKKESNKQNGDEKNGHIEGEDKENEENNLILNPSIQRAANQLEDLLIDMKSDCARIPQTVQRIPSIANRLQIGPPRTGASILPSASSRLM